MKLYVVHTYEYGDTLCGVFTSKEKELVNFYKEKTKDNWGYIQVVDRYVLWQD